MRRVRFVTTDFLWEHCGNKVFLGFHGDQFWSIVVQFAVVTVPDWLQVMAYPQLPLIESLGLPPPFLEDEAGWRVLALHDVPAFRRRTLASEALSTRLVDPALGESHQGS